MKSESRQEVIDRLLNELTALIDEYRKSLEADKIFEIRKNIRLRMKEIQRQVTALTQRQEFLQNGL